MRAPENSCNVRFVAPARSARANAGLTPVEVALLEVLGLAGMVPAPDERTATSATRMLRDDAHAA